MPSPYPIRSGRPADAPALADLGRRRWADAHRLAFTPVDLVTALDRDWVARVISDEMAEPETRYFVADEGERPVGMCALRQRQIPGRDEVATELCRLYLEPEHLGTGLGAALLDTALAACDQRGLDRCWLIAWERNDRALALYGRRGFEVVSAVPYQVGDSAPTAVVMIRRRPDGHAATQP